MKSAARNQSGIYPISFRRTLQSFAFRLAFVPAALPILLPVLLAPSASAQEFRGTISGAVVDPTGAAIPGAAVVVRETRTGTVNNTKSDAAGQYVVPFLLPGEYSITISMPGFQQTQRAGITLQSQEHPIINLTLAVGDTSQTVTVNTDAPLLDQANASVGQVISTESVADLPLNGRTPTTLTELSVGVITTAAPQIVHPFDNAAGNSWSIGGTPNQVSEVLLDGSPDLTLLGALAYAPTQDSVAEVSVRPFDTDASFGHTIGGVINQITKSGTNQFHGTAYDFYQTAGLDANLYFNKRQTPVQGRPNAHFQQYGGTFGGPVLIPKLFSGKDKLFFFFAYEGLKDSTPATTTLTVPTTAERTGDFSQTLYGACNKNLGGPYTVNPVSGLAYCNDTPTVVNANQIYNPFTATLVNGKVVRTPVVNNQLNSVQAINPVAAAYLNLFPAANTTSGVSASGQNNYVSPAPARDTYSNEFGRLDYNLSSRDHIFSDFRHNLRNNASRNVFGNNATGVTLLRENFGATLDNVFTLNPTTILDTRLNWTYFDEEHGSQAQQYSPNSVGLPSLLTSASERTQLPCVTFTTSTTIGTCGPSTTSFDTLGDNTSAIDPTTSYQVFADVIKVIGRNTLKIGFDGRQYRLSVLNFGNASGAFNFGTAFVTSGTGGTTQAFGGDLASFYFGLPTAGEYDLNSRSDYHSYYTGSFIQDDWRVTDHLTINAGLRFDIDTPFRERAGKTVNGFNPTAINSVSTTAAAAFKAPTVTSNGSAFTLANINTLGGLTFPGVNNGSVYNTNNGFLSPRFGFSYSPDGKTVVRGGFGIFVQPEGLSNMNSAGTTSSNALNNNEGFSSVTPYNATNNNYLTPAATLSNPFPNGFVTAAGAINGASTFLGQTISFLAPTQHDPYSERYNIGVQRSVTNSTLVEFIYQGNHSLHLPIGQQNINATKLQYLSTNPYRNQNLSANYGTAVANPFAGLLPNSASYNGATTALSNLLVPYPQFGSAAILEQNQTIGQSYFNSAIAHLEQRTKHGLTLTANFSYSKLIEADSFLNDQDTMPTRRISPFDHTYHFTTGGTYNLPLGRGKLLSFGGNRIFDEIFGGFVVNGIYQFQTGAPIQFTADIPLQPGATTRTLTEQTRNTSPITSGTPALSTSQFVTGSLTTAGDGSTFVNGQYTFHYRTLPQTISTLRQDGFNNLDASLLKDFHFTEKTYLQLRFETFNTLNHPVFAAPNVSSATASNFGYITAVAANSQPRQVQLGARLVF